MNVAVCMKQTPDTEAQIKISDDGTSIVQEGIKWIINPYDEFAIEEGLRLTEKHGGEVTLISLGPPSIEKTIREGLAMGAHKAIRIDAPAVPDDPMVTAKALAEVLKEESYDVILFGKQAIDDDHTQMASIVASILNLPAVTVVVELSIENGKGTAVREIEGGHEKVSFNLPVIISAQRGLNEPRYRSLKGIMAAKKKPIEVKSIALDEAQLVIETFSYPPPKKPGRIVGEGPDAVPELVKLLREEAKVI
ncbi:MAG: electron transfer flavoprotein subunit beta/FixA family protein [Calditrichaeota bacterium]|nr:electron transfer flavoprotein subunit beta/FixA family protein [Calditrichota bacterium]